MTELYPVARIAKDTYEIDIFDTGSVFLLAGEERAMVIDTGIGIGDLKAAIEALTDKPYFVVMTHGHGDHTGGAGQFGSYYMNEKDFQAFAPTASMDMRRGYSSMFPKKFPDRYYPWTEDDIVDFGDDIRRIPMTDGQVFDLGNRRVVAYECPGHTDGSMVLLDENTRCLFAGDAVNCNFLMRCETEKALAGIRRIAAMKDRFDGIYNGHHDYRPLGAPLDARVLPDAIALMEQIISGEYTPVTPPAGAFGTGGDSVTIMKNDTMITFSRKG